MLWAIQDAEPRLASSEHKLAWNGFRLLDNLLEVEAILRQLKAHASVEQVPFM